MSNRKWIGEPNSINLILNEDDYDVTEGEIINKSTQEGSCLAFTHTLNLEDFLSKPKMVQSENLSEIDDFDEEYSIENKAIKEDYEIIEEQTIEAIIQNDMKYVSQYLDSDNINIVKFKGQVHESVIEESNLEKIYGSLYVESKSKPRRFMIFKELAINSPVALVKIAKECDNSSISITLNIIGVSKQVTETFLERNQKETLELHSLIASILAPVELNVIKISDQRPRMKCQKKKNVTLIENLQKKAYFISLSDVFAISDLFCLENCILNSCHSYDTVSSVDNEFSSVLCKSCSNNCSLVTSLRDCGHCFCDDCWKKYLKTELSTKTNSHILCMVSGCKNNLDVATLFSLVSATEFHTYCTDFCREYVKRMPSILKFCSDGCCENIAYFKDGVTMEENKGGIDVDIPVATCLDCEKSWCFKCQKENHWPSSCDTYEKYIELKAMNPELEFDKTGAVIDNRHLDKMIKRCPNCKIYIEKLDGCNRMMCQCNYEFCWRCLQDRYDHSQLICSAPRPIELCIMGKNESYQQKLLFAEAVKFDHFSDIVKKYVCHLEQKRSMGNTSESFNLQMKGFQILHALYQHTKMVAIARRGYSKLTPEKRRLTAYYKELLKYICSLPGFEGLTANFYCLADLIANVLIKDIPSFTRRFGYFFDGV